MENSRKIYRGQIYWVDLPRHGTHPAVIISNDIANKHSPQVIVAYMSSKVKKILSKEIPTNVYVHKRMLNNGRSGVIVCNSIYSVRKEDVKLKHGELDRETIIKVNDALEDAQGLKFD